MKLLLFTCAATLLLFCTSPVQAEEKEDVLVEQTTESPINDMAVMVNDTLKADALNAEMINATKRKEENKKQFPPDSQQHTIADFVIHPLIALKPRLPSTLPQGKQADTSSSAPSPWQFFPFNAGQGLGSSVSSFAGWLGNRIQLPGLVETPVREASASAATTTTTTTTIRPDVIVRIKSRASTRKPSLANNNNNARPYRRRVRPNRFNAFNYLDDYYYSDEYDNDDDYDYGDDYNGNRGGNRRRYQGDEEDEDEEEDGLEGGEYDSGNSEEDDERPIKQGNNYPKSRPKPVNSNQRRYGYNANQRKRINTNQRKYNQAQQEDSVEDDHYVDYNDNEDFYYNNYQLPKRSQNGQTANKADNNSLQKQHQRPTLVINRNGEVFYVAAPKLTQVSDTANSQIGETSQYLSVPYKSKGKPIQYITIPWSQLGLPPQSQPVIFNIPGEIQTDNTQSIVSNKSKPSITTNAEASSAVVHKPTRKPPARLPAANRPIKKPVVVANKTKFKPTPPTRTDTVVEEASTDGNTDDRTNSSPHSSTHDTPSTQYIVVGEDFADRKLSRSAYRQILNYFNKNRVGRQMAGGAEVFPAKEQLIPVQLITGEDEPLKQETIRSDNLETTTKPSVIAESPKEES